MLMPDAAALEAAGVEFIAENGGDAGWGLSKAGLTWLDLTALSGSTNL